MCFCTQGKLYTTYSVNLKTFPRNLIAKADIVTYTTCIDACEGHWVWTLQLLDELERDRLQGNARTYSAAMKSCEHWPSALEFLEVMHRRQIQANLVVHNACLHACAKGAQWSLVLDQLEALPSRLLSADVVTYATAMHAAVRGSAWPHGLALFQKMSTWTVQGWSQGCQWSSSARMGRNERNQ